MSSQLPLHRPLKRPCVWATTMNGISGRAALGRCIPALVPAMHEAQHIAFGAQLLTQHIPLRQQLGGDLKRQLLFTAPDVQVQRPAAGLLDLPGNLLPGCDLLAINGQDEVAGPDSLLRSEERRVGKECRSRWSPYH